MKVDLSDKQCAKKHKKFFISLHFPLLLYFSLFLEARKERERSHKGFIRKFEICTSTLNMSSEKMFSNCLCCCSLCLKIIILSFSMVLFVLLHYFSMYKIFLSSELRVLKSRYKMTDKMLPDVFLYWFNVLIILFFRNKISHDNGSLNLYHHHIGNFLWPLKLNDFMCLRHQFHVFFVLLKCHTTISLLQHLLTADN